MSNYDVAEASATYVDPTGQTEYVLTLHGEAVWLSGTNLNDGTEWVSHKPVEQPERFGPLTTIAEFFAWVALFVKNED